MPTRILIADDHSLLRQGLRQLLADEFPTVEIVEADGLDAALEILARAPADLLLFDLGMPGMAGADSLRALRESYPESRIIVVTGVEDRTTILECLAAGVHGYVLKASPVEEFIRAVQMVLAGDMYVAAALSNLSAQPRPEPRPLPATAVVMAPPSPPAVAPIPSNPTQFTARQLEVLQLLGEGRSTKDIARILDLGPGTVKIHLAAIYRRLNAHNRTEAVILASRLKH